MGIQNGINNLLGIAAAGSGAMKHFKMQGLSARASSLSQVAHTEKEVAGMEEDALQSEVNYNEAVQAGQEIEQSYADKSSWAYQRAREEADKRINLTRMQMEDFHARLDTLNAQLDVTEEIEKVTKKGWMR